MAKDIVAKIVSLAAHFSKEAFYSRVFKSMHFVYLRFWGAKDD